MSAESPVSALDFLQDEADRFDSDVDEDAFNSVQYGDREPATVLDPAAEAAINNFHDEGIEGTTADDTEEALHNANYDGQEALDILGQLGEGGEDLPDEYIDDRAPGVYTEIAGNAVEAEEQETGDDHYTEIGNAVEAEESETGDDHYTAINGHVPPRSNTPTWTEILGEDPPAPQEFEGDTEGDEDLSEGAIEDGVNKIYREINAPGDEEIYREGISGYGGIEAEIVDQPFENLGELITKSPAFRKYAEEMAAANGAVLRKTSSVKKARDWQMDFGPASAPAGSVTTITKRPQCFFRVDKVMATDTHTTRGMGTQIMTVMIGQKVQRPAGTGATLSLFFSEQALGNGVKWDTGQPALDIAVTVSFITACTFYMSVFGRAVI